MTAADKRDHWILHIHLDQFGQAWPIVEAALKAATPQDGFTFWVTPDDLVVLSNVDKTLDIGVAKSLASASWEAVIRSMASLQSAKVIDYWTGTYYSIPQDKREAPTLTPPNLDIQIVQAIGEGIIVLGTRRGFLWAR